MGIPATVKVTQWSAVLLENLILSRAGDSWVRIEYKEEAARGSWHVEEGLRHANLLLGVTVPHFFRN